ncbi:LysR family transcriptional regulator [Croceicoccus estronivorus]|uniref:LysR family transcriptional regulator n=1 Tax=Croceicoccus estronivorus TaxID=1172626 RepID=UPI00082969F4|nr:LysR family transcriptional regulator [Croceicoccus estronivorus]OCC25588.1 LysR family transcriptional regulator [Croceicoccus estronivorus]
MVTWRGIEEFLAVVETGSFTAGAETLGVSKSYVSKMVSELEARVGAQLLLRTTRRLSLTAAGDLFHQRCQEMRASLVDVERQLTQFQERPVGRLRVGLSDIFGVAFMSAIAAEFGARHPEISMEVVAYLREAELVQEQFDVIIRYGRLNDSNLKARLFGYLSYCLCASPDYVAAHGWPSSPTNLAGHSCLTDLGGHFYFHDEDAASGRIKVSGNWKSNSGIALASAARHGLGIAQIPISVIREDLTEGRLVALDQEWAFFDKEVWAVFSPGMMPAATRAFIDHLAMSFEHRKLRPWMQPAMTALDEHLRGGQ